MWVIWELVVVGSLPTRPKSYTVSGGYKAFKKAAVQEGLHPTGSIRPRGVCSPGCWLSSPGAVAPSLLLHSVTSWLLLPASTRAMGGAAELWPGMTFFLSHFLGIPYHHLGLSRVILTLLELFFTFISYYYYIYYLEVRVGSPYSWFSSTMWVQDIELRPSTWYYVLLTAKPSCWPFLTLVILLLLCTPPLGTEACWVAVYTPESTGGWPWTLFTLQPSVGLPTWEGKIRLCPNIPFFNRFQL